MSIAERVTVASGLETKPMKREAATSEVGLGEAMPRRARTVRM